MPHPKRHRELPLDKKYFRWMRHIGPVLLLVSWLPGIDDSLCTLTGWLHLKFWPSVMYMAVDKFLRYLTITTTFMISPDDF